MTSLSEGPKLSWRRRPSEGLWEIKTEKWLVAWSWGSSRCWWGRTMRNAVIGQREV